MFSYTVTCTFDDPAVAEEWIEWLRGGHLAEVCAAGAVDAEVIAFDEEKAGARRCEVRYHFASRAAFKTYERDHAPRLRQQGLARFPPERGLRYERRTGEVVHFSAASRCERSTKPSSTERSAQTPGPM